jgi:hypothetical protein
MKAKEDHLTGASTSAGETAIGRKLRLGLLMDSSEIPNWAYTMLSRIAGSDYGAIELVVFNESDTLAVPNSGGPQPLTPVVESPFWETANSLLQRAVRNHWVKPITRLLRRVAKAHHLHGNSQGPNVQELWTSLINEPAPEPNALEPMDSSDLLRAVPAIQVGPKPTQLSALVNAGDIATVKAYNLDVLIRLGLCALRGEMLNAARFGVWSFDLGDNDARRRPAGVWEVLEGAPCTACVLQILGKEPGNAMVLARSWSATVPFSIVANRNQLYWKSALLLPRKLEELHRFGERAFFEKVKEKNRHLGFYSHPPYNTPTQSELNLLLPRLQQRSEELARQQKSSWEQWILLYDLKEAGPSTSGPSTSLWRYKRIVPPQDRYWADPFPVLQDGRYWIFIEEYLLDAAKGHISVFAMDCNGKYEAPTRVLERPYHLSYPFIFRYQGSWYMIPETKQNRSVELYESVSFPDQWKLRRVLLDGVEAVDPTLFAYRGKWWLFANMVENKSATSTWDELFVFHTDDPIEGVWKSHARNPIVSDVRRARPAGRLFVHNGIIYRPGQDCSRCYGYGIRLHEILTLTEEEYREKEVCAIEPLWAPDLLGVHTLNFEQELSVADALTLRRRGLPESPRA